MFALKDYGSSDENNESDDGSSAQTINSEVNVSQNSNNLESVSTEKPVIMHNLQICAAPEVEPTGTELCIHHIDSTSKEVMHNPKFEELRTRCWSTKSI